MVKLSIIVPVYNVAPYLQKCVESLIRQDYDDYEIILVDDGSSDESGMICDKYVRAFEEGDLRKEIKCIHQSNAGLGAARNAGLMIACGEYVCFVDSDDYWEPNVLGKLIEQCERENLDVLRFDYQNVRLKNECVNGLHEESDYEVFMPNKYPHEVDPRMDVVDGVTYLNMRMGYSCYAVMFVIRKSLIFSDLATPLHNLQTKKGNVLFTPGIHFEDVEWLPRMMLRAKRVNSTLTIVYNYYVREGSITQTQGDMYKMRKNNEDCMRVVEKYSTYRMQEPACTWLYNMQSSMAAGVLTSVARTFYPERRGYIKRLKRFGVFPLSLAVNGKTYLRRARLINLFGAESYCRIIHTLVSIKGGK